MSHFYLVSAVIIWLFFCNSRTSHRGSCDWVVRLLIQAYIDQETQPQPSIFGQFYTALATEWHWLCMSYQVDGFQSGGSKYFCL